MPLFDSQDTTNSLSLPTVTYVKASKHAPAQPTLDQRMDSTTAMAIDQIRSSANSLQHLIHPREEENRVENPIPNPLPFLNHFKEVPQESTNPKVLLNNLVSLKRHNIKPGKISLFGFGFLDDQSSKSLLPNDDGNPDAANIVESRQSLIPSTSYNGSRSCSPVSGNVCSAGSTSVINTPTHFEPVSHLSTPPLTAHSNEQFPLETATKLKKAPGTDFSLDFESPRARKLEDTPRTTTPTGADKRGSSLVKECETLSLTEGDPTPVPSYHSSRTGQVGLDQVPAIVDAFQPSDSQILNKVLGDSIRLRLSSVTDFTRISKLATPPPLYIKDENDAGINDSDPFLSGELNDGWTGIFNAEAGGIENATPKTSSISTETEIEIAEEAADDPDKCSETESQFSASDDEEKTEHTLPTPRNTPPPSQAPATASCSSSPRHRIVERENILSAPLNGTTASVQERSNPLPPLPSPAPLPIIPSAALVNLQSSKPRHGTFLQTTHENPRKRYQTYPASNVNTRRGDCKPSLLAGELESAPKLEPSSHNQPAMVDTRAPVPMVKKEKVLKEEKVVVSKEEKTVLTKRKRTYAPSERVALKAGVAIRPRVKRPRLIPIERKVSSWTGEMNRYLYLANKESRIYHKDALVLEEILNEIDARKQEISRELLGEGNVSLGKMLRSYCHKTEYSAFKLDLREKARNLVNYFVNKFKLVDPNHPRG